MKHFTSLTFLLLAVFTSFSQTQTITNQHDFGTSSVESSIGSIKCQDGGLLLFCTTGTIINGTKTAPSYGGTDIWLIKLDQYNNYQWDKSFGGSDGEQLGSVIELSNGDFLVGGTTKSPVSGNQTVGTKGLNDFWILKLTSNGDEIWQKSFGGTDHDLMEDLIEISPEKYLLTGRSFSGVSGDKTEACRGSIDTWTVMIDSSGVKIWDKTIGGDLGDTPVKLAYTAGASIFYLVAYSESPISGDKTENGFGWNDAWVLAIDTNSNLINQKTIGGTDDDIFNSIFIKDDSTLLLFGGSGSGISGNKTSPISGPGDAWLIQLSSNLDIMLDLSFGGDGSESFTGMIQTINNEMILYGGSSSSNSGIIAEANMGSSDNWILSLDQNYAVNFSELVGGNNSEGIVGLFEKSHNNYTIVSLSYSGISGDKTVPNFGTNSIDFWVFDMSTNLAVGEQLGNQDIQIVPNPNNGTFVLNGSEPGTEFTLFDINGKVLLNQKTVQSNEQVQLRNSQPGMYFIKVSTDKAEGYLKFSVE
jgi:hypothetical protein